MAPATRLPLKSIAFFTTLVLAAARSRFAIWDLALKTFTGPGNYSRIAALAIALINIKNLPGVWHYRVFNALLRHCLFSKRHIPADLAPSTLFLPVITSSYSPFSECDYNLHKSNSTYFSDLDVTRSHLMCCLLQPGISKLHNNTREKLVLNPAGEPVPELWNIMLGSVQCSFKREIGMYQGFEMWSRLLCWDRKWIYVVTHFVKKGTVRPPSYILTDGSWLEGKGPGIQGDGNAAAEDVEEKNIFASAISKYVVKLGRLTVHPEVLLGASGMLPERPGGWAVGTVKSGESTPATLDVGSEDGTTTTSEESTNEWDWKRIVAQNEKGLKYAEHLSALDGLHNEFSGSRQPALGRYRDFIFV